MLFICSCWPEIQRDTTSNASEMVNTPALMKHSYNCNKNSKFKWSSIWQPNFNWVNDGLQVVPNRHTQNCRSPVERCNTLRKRKIQHYNQSQSIKSPPSTTTANTWTRLQPPNRVYVKTTYSHIFLWRCWKLVSFKILDPEKVQYRSKVSYHPLARRDSRLAIRDSRLAIRDSRLERRETRLARGWKNCKYIYLGLTFLARVSREYQVECRCCWYGRTPLSRSKLNYGVRSQAYRSWTRLQTKSSLLC